MLWRSGCGGIGLGRLVEASMEAVNESVCS